MYARRTFLFLIILISIVGCSSPLASLSARPVDAASLAQVPGSQPASPKFIVAAEGASPTPTPFQPIPPTPIIIPEDEPTPEPEIEVTPTPEIILEETQEQALEAVDGQINLLLLGADARPWSNNFRTDTIILVTFNPSLGRVNVTSFPRDLYITVPGWGLQRINSAWTYGKFNLLAKTFEHNFGIRPDYYALVKFSSFKQMIDSLGGLDVNVGKQLSDYRAGYWVTIPKGLVHMDADKVLWYVRSRKTTNDFARNQRQQEVLQALFMKLISMDALRRTPELYENYKDGFMTNVDLVDILSWLPLAARVAEHPENINFQAVTYNHVSDYITPYGGMVLLPNQQKLMNVVRKSQNLE